MRRSLFCTIVFSVLLSPVTAFAEQSNPCDGVSCTGHGRCIVIRGEPGCACEEGYEADAVGLNCYEVESAPSPPEETEVEAASIVNHNRVLSHSARGFRTWLAGTLLHAIGAVAIITGTALILETETAIADYAEEGVTYYTARVEIGQIVSISGGGTAFVGLVLSIVGLALARRNHNRAEHSDTSYRTWTILAAPTGDGGGVFGFTGSF